MADSLFFLACDRDLSPQTTSAASRCLFCLELRLQSIFGPFLSPRPQESQWAVPASGWPYDVGLAWNVHTFIDECYRYDSGTYFSVLRNTTNSWYVVDMMLWDFTVLKLRPIINPNISSYLVNPNPAIRQSDNQYATKANGTHCTGSLEHLGSETKPERPLKPPDGAVSVLCLCGTRKGRNV